MDLNNWLDNQIMGLDPNSEYDLDGIRDSIVQRLVNLNVGYRYLTATKAVEKYLINRIINAASRL